VCRTSTRPSAGRRPREQDCDEDSDQIDIHDPPAGSCHADQMTQSQETPASFLVASVILISRDFDRNYSAAEM
jgi:hypothetical protein